MLTDSLWTRPASSWVADLDQEREDIAFEYVRGIVSALAMLGLSLLVWAVK